MRNGGERGCGERAVVFFQRACSMRTQNSLRRRTMRIESMIKTVAMITCVLALCGAGCKSEISGEGDGVLGGSEELKGGIPANGSDAGRGNGRGRGHDKDADVDEGVDEGAG